ncbi:hypothetical protein [Pyramidobacter piscolens]|uniref:hypothetical protein n=1 Tax=Pyramidobacter piscolens TaxID=638849 RepID=UPI002666AD5D|nr:hypothetical protein [Pyramidobacter piscolens]
MKKLSTAVLFFMLLVPAVCAKEVDGGFFVADIPSGWTMKKQAPAVILASPKRDTIVTVAKAPTEGRSVREIAEAACKEMEGEDFEDLGNESYDYAAEVDGAPLYVQIYGTGEEGECAVITIWGEQSDSAAAVFDSIQMK